MTHIPMFTEEQNESGKERRKRILEFTHEHNFPQEIIVHTEDGIKKPYNIDHYLEHLAKL